MQPHVHVGVLEFGIFFLMLLIAGFLIRIVETRWPDSPVGRALGFVYG